MSVFLDNLKCIVGMVFNCREIMLEYGSNPQEDIGSGSTRDRIQPT